MITLLQVDSSPMGDASISRRLTAEFAQRWLRVNPGGRIVHRDLAATRIPVIDAAWVAANLAPAQARTPAQNDLLRLSDELTAELLDASEYVIGAPMHNWGPSASLKLWIDQILRFGRTLAFTPSGTRGLLAGKRATFLIAAGGNYAPGSPEAAKNYLEPWLRTYFEYLGVHEMQFVRADGARAVLEGKIERTAYLAPHLAAVEALFQQAVAR